MPRDGNGVYQPTDGVRSGRNLYEQQRVAGVNPNTGSFDNILNDMAEALSASIARDGQTTPSADLPMSGRKHTGVADAEAVDQYATLRQLIALAFPFIAAADVGGTGDAIELTAQPDPGVYTVGRGFRFFARSPNSGPLTIAEGGRAATAARRSNNTPFEGDEIVAGMPITAVYDGVRFVTDVPPPAAPPSDILNAVAGGTANAITLTLAAGLDSPDAYAAFKGYRFFAAAENTGSLTLAEGTKPAVQVRRYDNTAFEGGEITAGMLVEVRHDGTRFQSNIGLRDWFGTQAQFTAATKRAGVKYRTR